MKKVLVKIAAMEQEIAWHRKVVEEIDAKLQDMDAQYNKERAPLSKVGQVHLDAMDFLKNAISNEFAGEET